MNRMTRIDNVVVSIHDPYRLFGVDRLVSIVDRCRSNGVDRSVSIDPFKKNRMTRIRTQIDSNRIESL